MRVLYVDDEVDNLETMLHELTFVGWNVETYADAEDMKREWGGRSDDVIALIDHDLGRDASTGRAISGYEVVAWLRKSHPRGTLLPIVYLTGRESIEGFVAHQTSDPYAHPTMFLSKGDAAMPQFSWTALLEDLTAKFERAKARDDDQRVERGLELLRDLDGDLEV